MMDMQGYKQPMQPGVEFVVLMSLWLGCFLVGSVITIPIWYGMTGESVFQMQKGMMDPKNLSAVKVVQAVSTFVIFFLPAFITARIASRSPWTHLGYRGGLKFNRVLVAVLLMATALPLVAWLADVNKAIPVSAELKKLFEQFERQYEEQVKMLAKFQTPGDYFTALFIMALMPAIVEETFFRGGLQQVLHRWSRNPHLAILLTGLIFSVIHFSYFGFLPRVALGMVLGYIFYLSGNLWYSIIGHFFNNALMVTVLYAQYLKDKNIDTQVGESAPWWAGLLSLGILIFLFLLLRQLCATRVAADSIADASPQNNFDA